MTQVSEVMTRGVRSLSPQDSLVVAAQAMQQLDVGVVPVCEGERLVGLVTDRDLVVRGMALGRPAEKTALETVMSRDLRCCFEDQPVDEVLEQMRDARIRRVPVLDHEEHLVGMLSLGDVAVKADGDGAGIVLQEVSEPAQPDQDQPRDDMTRDDENGANAATEAAEAEASRASHINGQADDGRWADRGVPPRTDGKKVWVLVADEAIARILQRPEVGDELESVEELTDPAAHAKEGEMRDDAYGRRAGSATHGARPNTPHRTRSSANVTSSAGEDQQHLEAQSFARRVALHLAEALRQRRFDELRIVAAPRFLGHLRKELDAQVSATVTDEINKDLVHLVNADITQRVFGPASGESPA
jgi:CBS domain-containing protein/protein required for attachment to host cells